MPTLQIGGKQVADIEIGGKTVSSIAADGVVIYEKAHSIDYFYLQRVSGTPRVSLKKCGTPQDITLEYSTDDGSTWTTWSSVDGDLQISLTGSQTKVMLRGNNSTFSADSNNYFGFIATDRVEVGGNIMTLLDSTGELTSLAGKNYCFVKLFGAQQPNYFSIGDLKLPATTLSANCYDNMFYYATSITTVPEDLLPATTLATGCYASMFHGCRNLTKSPILPATVLAQFSYGNMFNGCSALSEVTTYANNISANYCLQDWLKDVSGTGDFYRLGSANYPGGASGIPSGWTVHTSL